jgi:uncharacterized damage-inducible protein DinB
MSSTLPEVWLRGPVRGVPPLLQPVAHALLQAREEIATVAASIDVERLWDRPHGLASCGFHLLHISGVVDRLFTYARGGALDEEQRARLKAEVEPADTTAADLAAAFGAQVERALEQLRATDEDTLGEARAVGRQQLPSTVQGLLFHAAEHVQRHVGQLRVTARVAGGG